MDLSAISIPLGYVFGRLGNFFNHELFGRLVEDNEFGRSIGILVNGELRYPSQLFEAFAEGIVVFVLLLVVLRYAKRAGSLIVAYGFFYAIARFVCEYYREADSQLGYYAFGLSMGQILSCVMFVASVILAFVVFSQNTQKPKSKSRRRK